MRVQYEGYATRWTIHPRALARVTTYTPGDVVIVISDVNKVKEYQKGHGEWIEYMKSVSLQAVVRMKYSCNSIRNDGDNIITPDIVIMVVLVIMVIIIKNIMIKKKKIIVMVMMMMMVQLIMIIKYFFTLTLTVSISSSLSSGSW